MNELLQLAPGPAALKRIVFICTRARQASTECFAEYAVKCFREALFTHVMRHPSLLEDWLRAMVDDLRSVVEIT